MTREVLYNDIISEVTSIIQGENNFIANASNICAIINEKCNFIFWIGLYMVCKQIDELILVVFQGPLACCRIKSGQGVCDVAWQDKVVQVIDYISKCNNHIACSSKSKSEIVMPGIHKEYKDVMFVLDIDSEMINMFDDVDIKYLNKIVSILENSYCNDINCQRYYNYI